MNIATAFKPPSVHAKGDYTSPCPRAERPIFLTLQETEDWCVDIMEENAYRQGPFAIALIERYSGPVSVLDIVP